MKEKFVALMLRPLGLYKVNRAYLREEKKQLADIEASLSVAVRAASGGSEVVGALRGNDPVKAAAGLLKFCEIDDKAGRLKDVQAKIAKGASPSAAVAAVRGSGLTADMVAAARGELTDRCRKFADLKKSSF